MIIKRISDNFVNYKEIFLKLFYIEDNVRDNKINTISNIHASMKRK